MKIERELPQESLNIPHVGALDDPSDFAPELVMFASRGHAWDRLDPALPKVPNMRPSK